MHVAQLLGRPQVHVFASVPILVPQCREHRYRAIPSLFETEYCQWKFVCVHDAMSGDPTSHQMKVCDISEGG